MLSVLPLKSMLAPLVGELVPTPRLPLTIRPLLGAVVPGA